MLHKWFVTNVTFMLQSPVGVMCVLDDTCATMHAVSDGADQKFLGKLTGAVGSHQHYQSFK